MNGLIGYTGFVGKNLDSSVFQLKYNSQNIQEICGQQFDFLVCAGVPGHKTLANQFPQKDWASISLLIECLEQVKCSHIVLISTIDVFQEGTKGDEDSLLSETGLPAYGRHRLKMECFISEYFDNHTIIRLPGIFGKGLKKNFIFDLIFKIPRMFSTEEFSSLKKNAAQSEALLLEKCYQPSDNGILSLKTGLKEDVLAQLRAIIEKYQYTSLRFTDSRSIFSYYDLSLLKNDLRKVIEMNIPLIQMVTAPVTAAELAEQAFGQHFCNEIKEKPPISFRLKSKYAALWGGENGYLYSQKQIIQRIKMFNRDSIEV